MGLPTILKKGFLFLLYRIVYFPLGLFGPLLSAFVVVFIFCFHRGLITLSDIRNYPLISGDDISP